MAGAGGKSVVEQAASNPTPKQAASHRIERAHRQETIFMLGALPLTDIVRSADGVALILAA